MSSPFASSFDMLAGSTSSANRSYTSSPLPRSLNPSAPPQPPKPAKSPVNGAGGGADAFAGLFSLGGGSTSQTSPTGLSLAQRQAQLAAAQQDKKAAEVGAFQSAGTFWDQFEGGKGAGGGLKPAAAAPARTSSPALVPSPSPRPTTPSVPLKPTPSLSVSSPQPKAAQQSLDPWGEFDDLVSGPSPTSSTPKPPSSPSDAFDFLDHPAPTSTTSRSKQSAVPNGRRSGDRGDDDSSGLLGSGDKDEDDDFMSAFNRPPPRKVSSSTMNRQGFPC